MDEDGDLAKHYGQVMGYAYYLTGSADEAADIAQETYLRALRHARARGPPRKPLPWLRMIALNVVRSGGRRLASPDHGQSSDGLDRIADSSPGIEAVVEQDEQEQLRRYLGGLSTKDQQALELAYGGTSRPYEEIERELGLSRGAFKVRVFRARQRASAHLKERFGPR